MSESADLFVPEVKAVKFARLSQGLKELPQPFFAVLDGAQWDDFPATLEEVGLERDDATLIRSCAARL